MSGTPKVILLSEQFRGQSHDLTENEYNIGRTEDCQIYLPDPTISSLHARLLLNDDGSYSLKDEGSTNGTRVNGVRIKDEIQELVASDIIQVGGVELLYDSDDGQGGNMTTTQTVIQLDDTNTGELEIGNINGLDKGKSSSKGNLLGRENKKVALLIKVGLGLLVLLVVVAIIMFIANMLQS